jgi:DNA-directed RNA polymerase subunit RPC12/RpoP
MKCSKCQPEPEKKYEGLVFKCEQCGESFAVFHRPRTIDQMAEDISKAAESAGCEVHGAQEMLLGLLCQFAEAFANKEQEEESDDDYD